MIYIRVKMSELKDDLEGVITRTRPESRKTEVMSLIKSDSRVCQLYEKAKKKGREYTHSVREYIRTYFTYKLKNQPRQLIEDLDAIKTGVDIANKLDKEDKFVIMLRDSHFAGNWMQMLTNLQTSELFSKMVKQQFLTEAAARINKLKEYEETYKLNLADYCVII